MNECRSYWFNRHFVDRSWVETTVQPSFSAPMLVIKDGELVVAQKV
jgi:hypothetical protein